ncbi:hypothetical protein [Oribacterium sp. P6A1]|uniref:hypothetical protein n=1 Tax=Oribacterium sp. P6A1 TaxID=1410612 RepID=UPI00056A916D|nr:hypothetical protein [Oribacterium sp. P6A1]
MTTEVIFQNGFQEKYFRSDSKGKIEMILENYITFQHQLSGIENGIKMDIKYDQDIKARNERGNLGLRVQTSCVSDPTAKEAIRNIELDRAFEENDLEMELERTGTPEVYRNQLMMLDSMRDDYHIIQIVISTLSSKDSNSLNDYFAYQRQNISFVDVADKKDMPVGSVYQKYWRVKCKVKKGAIGKFERKYGRKS